MSKDKGELEEGKEASDGSQKDVDKAGDPGRGLPSKSAKPIQQCLGTAKT